MECPEFHGHCPEDSGHSRTTLGGCLTGGYSELASAEVKAMLMEDLPKQLEFDPALSFAFGDSESDRPLFEVVAPANVFILGTPCSDLARSANAHGWTVIPPEGDVLAQVGRRIRRLFSHLTR